VLVQSAYSRDFETEADNDAVTTLRKMGQSPAAMATLLERLEKKRCGQNGCGGSWLGDHPDTARRAALFRSGK
jgi:predicted Zn-dependent protease